MKKLISQFKRLIEQYFKIRILITPWGHNHGLFITDDLKRQGIPFKMIFDVGAHTGQTATKYAQAFPDARVIAFEPVPENFNRLINNVRQSSSVECHQLALSSESGECIIYLSEHDTAHSMVHSVGRQSGGIVKMTTLDAFCKAHRISFIDLLKIDTEGHDLEVLKGGEQLLSAGKISYILVETGFNRCDSYFCQYEDVRDYLSDRDYQVFGFYEQALDWEQRRRLLFGNAAFVHSSVKGAWKNI